MSKRYRLGLIGYGTIGKVHEKVIQTPKSKFDLIAISDIQKQKAPTGVRFYKDYKDLLSKESVNAIAIATPPSSHYQIVLDCINASKHALVEKPPTIDSKACRLLEKLAINNRVTFFTAFHMRYNPAVVQATKKLANANIERIEIVFKEYVFNFHDPSRWIFNPTISGGGVLMDSGINALSVVKSILQDNFAFKVRKVKLVKGKKMQIETSARVEFVFGDGNKGSLEMDWLYKDEDIRMLHFYADGNVYTVDINKGSLSKNNDILFQLSPNENTMLLEYKGAFKHFAESLKKGISFVSTDELKFIENVYKKAM